MSRSELTAAQESARLVILSATMAERLVELRAAIARVRTNCGAGVRMFVSSQVMAWTPQAVRALEVDLAAPDALETLSGARRLLTEGTLALSPASPAH